MGFSSGVTDEDIKTDADATANVISMSIDNSCSVQDEAMQQDEEPPKKKPSRFPVVYGEDEVLHTL